MSRSARAIWLFRVIAASGFACAAVFPFYETVAQLNEGDTMFWQSACHEVPAVIKTI
jgi:hypothetical protein